VWGETGPADTNGRRGGARGELVLHRAASQGAAAAATAWDPGRQNPSATVDVGTSPAGADASDCGAAITRHACLPLIRLASSGDVVRSAGDGEANSRLPESPSTDLRTGHIRQDTPASGRMRIHE